MAAIELEGFEEYIKQLSALNKSSYKLCKYTVYPGAKVLADALRAEVNGLPAMSDNAAKAHWRAGAVMPMISESQKIGLQDSLGISPITRSRGGRVQCSVGFEGYNRVVTHHFPNGQPNNEVARSLEKGTSYLQRDAFATRAVKAATNPAIEAMAEAADEYVQKVMDANG